MTITSKQRRHLDQRVTEILGFDKQTGSENEFLEAMQALAEERTLTAELVAALKEMVLLVEDFMPNIGRCVLKNYQRMNEAPIAANAAISKAEGQRWR